MFKSFTKAALFVLFLGSVTDGYAQYSLKDLAPYYIKPDFITNKNAGYWRGGYPLIGRLKYVPGDPEMIKFMPKETRLLNQDGGFELVNISPGNNMQSETWIAINPKDPNNIIATANDYAYISSNGYRMSSWDSKDGGKTWTHATTAANLGVYINAPTGGSMTIFDPGVAFDVNGNALYSYGFTQIVPNSNEEGGVFVASSTDGGASWEGWGKDVSIPKIMPVALSKDEGNVVFHDRYTLAADNNENSPYKNTFYLAWQRFKYNDGVVLKKSNDFGVTWSDEIPLGTGGTQAPMPAVGPNGELYVTWIKSDNQSGKAFAQFRSSMDGGNNFTNEKTAQVVYSIGNRNASSGRFTLTSKQSMRVSSPPQIAVDRSNKSTRGWVYVVQAGRETGAANAPYGIYVSRSKDKGATWTSNIRIDNSELRNDMFFPSIAVDPITGMVVVFYYSSQNDATNTGYDGYIAFSNDGGDTWKQIRVTPETYYINSSDDVADQGEAGNYYWGDYTSIDAYNGKIFPLFWMANKSQGYNVSTCDIFTALISTNPMPPKNLVAESINEGQTKIKLDWEHPLTDMMGTELPAFKVYVYRNNEKIGEIDKSAPAEFVDAGVVSGSVYKYALKTVLPNGQESILIETTIAAGGALQPNPPTDISWRPASNGFILTWKNPTTAIDNSTLKDLAKINVYQNGVFAASVSKEQFSDVSNPSLTVPLPINKFYKITLKAVGSRNGVETESEASTELIVYSGPAFEAFQENFDDPATQKPFYTNKTWATTSAVKASGQYSLTDSPAGNYTNNNANWFLLPPVVIGSATKTLSFNQIALIHTSDYGLIEVSKDFGKTYKSVRGVDIRFSDKFIKGNAAGSQWVSLDQDLSKDFMGDTILVRIGLYSNALTVDDGWYIDDIMFDSRVAGLTETVTPQLKADLSLYPNPTHETSNISLTINNTANVVMGVYDSMGRLISEQVNGDIAPGIYSYAVNATNLADGVYYVRLTVDGETRATPFVIAK